MASLIAFFTKLWSPGTAQAEQLGYAYTYDEQGTLIAEVGSGGTTSTGQSQYIYLPTANGPIPVAAVIDGATYAVHSDHLNTPRRLSNADDQAVWQWGYSAFGEDKPTLARNRFAKTDTATGNPLGRVDPTGLFSPYYHRYITEQALKAAGLDNCKKFELLPIRTMKVDYKITGSQLPANSHWHAMRDGTTQQTIEQAEALYNEYVATHASTGKIEDLAKALHAVEDSAAGGHKGFQPWGGGLPSSSHMHDDWTPSPESVADAINKATELLRQYGGQCECK